MDLNVLHILFLNSQTIFQKKN